MCEVTSYINSESNHELSMVCDLLHFMHHCVGYAKILKAQNQILLITGILLELLFQTKVKHLHFMANLVTVRFLLNYMFILEFFFCQT